jgi:glycosyltransferase involved in cell wall biosynthesis
MNRPLISVSIPTKNSAKTLGLCLKALRAQTMKDFEINIIDKNSTDTTQKIAERYKVDKIKNVAGSLLEARYEGVKILRGKYVLILDSDQVLEKNTLKRAIDLIKKEKSQMLVLEETVYKKNTFIEKLFDCDRTLINKVNDLSPFTGVIMPRFFKRTILLKAYENIPKKIFPHTGGPDHAIVYYEASKISKNISILSNAVKHIKPKSLQELLPKFYRWGYTSRDAHFGKYAALMNKKERFRTSLFSHGLIKESPGSILLLLINKRKRFKDRSIYVNDG